MSGFSGNPARRLRFRPFYTKRHADSIHCQACRMSTQKTRRAAEGNGCGVRAESRNARHGIRASSQLSCGRFKDPFTGERIPLERGTVWYYHRPRFRIDRLQPECARHPRMQQDGCRTGLVSGPGFNNKSSRQSFGGGVIAHFIGNGTPMGWRVFTPTGVRFQPATVDAPRQAGMSSTSMTSVADARTTETGVHRCWRSPVTSPAPGSGPVLHTRLSGGGMIQRCKAGPPLSPHCAQDAPRQVIERNGHPCRLPASRCSGPPAHGADGGWSR